MDFHGVQAFQTVTAAPREGIEQILNDSNMSSNSSFELNATKNIKDSVVQAESWMRDWSAVGHGPPDDSIRSYATKAKQWYNERGKQEIKTMEMIKLKGYVREDVNLDVPVRLQDAESDHRAQPYPIGHNKPDDAYVWLWHATTRAKYARIMRDGEMKKEQAHGPMPPGIHMASTPAKAILGAKATLGEEFFQSDDSMVFAAPVYLGSVIDANWGSRELLNDENAWPDGPRTFYITWVKEKEDGLATNLVGPEWCVWQPDQVIVTMSVPFTSLTEDVEPILKGLVDLARKEQARASTKRIALTPMFTEPLQGKYKNYFDDLVVREPLRDNSTESPVGPPALAEMQKPEVPAKGGSDGCGEGQCCSCKSDWRLTQKVYDIVQGKDAVMCCRKKKSYDSGDCLEKRCLSHFSPKRYRRSHYTCRKVDGCR